MKQNKYDDEEFFSAYANMTRSIKGLDGAGEWHVFKDLIPDLQGKSILDLGVVLDGIAAMLENSMRALLLV